MSWRVEAVAAQVFERRRARALCVSASAVTLAALALAPRAHADVTVNGGGTAVATATAASSGADNISQTGTLNVSTGPAITLDSNNSVTNSGTIQMQDKSGLTGILGEGGYSGSITNSGSIVYNHSSAITSTDSNGVVTGPFAADSDLYGIRVTGSGALGGSIVNGGTITVQGDSSAGIFVEAPLTGAITSTGTISVSGTNSTGLRTTGAVGGAITLSGSVTATGQGAQAVSIGGDVGGGVAIEGAVLSSGYHTTSRGTTTSVLDDQNKNDIAQGGAAVTIAGSLANGLLISAPPIVASSSDTDVNDDGIADSGETTGTVTSYGSAPAIVIGAVGKAITLGAVGAGASAYSLVLEGTAAGYGLRDGVAAGGVQIGVDAGGAVNLTGGIGVSGTLTAQAYSADATALHLLSGASVAKLYNASSLTAVMTGETANAARAIVVEKGGALPTILNAGAISAGVVGSSGSATAILDEAGSLTHLENTGAIRAEVAQASGSTIPVTGAAVAIDDSANTTGLSLTSYQGAAYTTAPSIVGAIRMGSGNDSVDIEAGAVTGDLSFGAGANSLTVNGGATVIGGVTASGGTLALSVGAGALQINSTDALNLTRLNLAAASRLVLTVDPEHGSATSLNVDGAATIASGAKLGLRVTSIISGEASYTLVKASQLTSGVTDASFLTTTPYLYATSLVTDASAGTITLDLARKTAAQLGLDSAIAGAYAPVVSAIAGDPGLSEGLTTPTDKAGFVAALSQLLPEHSGAVFQLVRAGVEAFGRPLDDRQSPDGGGAWLEEVNVGAMAGDRDGLPGYKSWGFGLVGGVEAPATRLGVFGATVGGFSGEIRPHDTDAGAETIANVVELGGYWRATVGAFSFNARAAADYLSATNHRSVDFTSEGDTLFSGTASGHWSGWGVNSRLRATYEAHLGALYLRPQLGIDYMRLAEGAYAEGGNSALDLAVDSRTTSELTGFAGVAIGAVFGQQGASWGPELLLGYRDVAMRDGGETSARFVAGGETFTVGPNPVGGSGGVARVALKSESAWGAVSLEGGAETRDGLTVYDAKLAAHFLF